MQLVLSTDTGRFYLRDNGLFVFEEDPANEDDSSSLWEVRSLPLENTTSPEGFIPVEHGGVLRGFNPETLQEMVLEVRNGGAACWRHPLWRDIET